MPGGPHVTGDHAVGLGVVNELLLFGIPFEFTVQEHGHIAQMTDGRGAVSDFRVRHGLLAGFDAVQEVLLMIIAAIEIDLVPANGLLENGFGKHVQSAAVDLDTLFNLSEFLRYSRQSRLPHNLEFSSL